MLAEPKAVTSQKYIWSILIVSDITVISLVGSSWAPDHHQWSLLIGNSLGFSIPPAIHKLFVGGSTVSSCLMVLDFNLAF